MKNEKQPNADGMKSSHANEAATKAKTGPETKREADKKRDEKNKSSGQAKR